MKVKYDRAMDEVQWMRRVVRRSRVGFRDIVIHRQMRLREIFAWVFAGRHRVGVEGCSLAEEPFVDRVG
jgi:hypothetical protein